MKASPATYGVKDLSAVCPDLADALRELGLTPMLSDRWQEQINSDALRDLANLTDRYAAFHPTASPDVAALPAILHALQREQTSPSRSWWDAFGAWFKTWLGNHSQALRWLGDVLERMGRSKTLFAAIFYSLAALVLAAAVAVIVNELRAGGSNRRRRRAAGKAGADGPAAAFEDSEILEPGPLAERLSRLLRTLVSRLMQTRRLTMERSLTHRELVARSLFDDESQRAVFAAVADTAESILYGAHAAAPEHLDAVLREGRALLAQLSSPSSAR